MCDVRETMTKMTANRRKMEDRSDKTEREGHVDIQPVN